MTVSLGDRKGKYALVGWLRRVNGRTGRRRNYAGDLDKRAIPLREALHGLVRFSVDRDEASYGHCARVAENAVAVGKILGVSGHDLADLYWSALLHDVGKIGVSRTTLSKPGRLTEDELDEIRQHPVYGARLLLALSPLLEPIAHAVQHHHERWDGQGYPHSLRKTEIPLSARIIAAVDVLEALTSERPYRAPLRPDQAMVYIRRCAGTQFDPDVVIALESLFAQGRLAMADEPIGFIEIGNSGGVQPAAGVRATIRLS